MKYCTKCGKEMADDTAFCTICGTSAIGAGETQAKPSGQTAYTNTNSDFIKKIKGSGTETVSEKARFVRSFAEFLYKVQLVFAAIIGLVGIVFILTTDNMFFVDALGVVVGLPMLAIAALIIYCAKFTKFRIQLSAHQAEDINAIRFTIETITNSGGIEK